MNRPMSVDPEIRPADLVTTRASLPSTLKPQNLAAQLGAFCELSSVLANDPPGAIRRSLEIAMRLCHAGSAGLSLLQSDRTGQSVVRWETVSGELAAHEGTDTPRHRSACGLCLDAGETVLLEQPARAFSHLRDTSPNIVQDLIVPLRDHANNSIGTVWLAHHDTASRFSEENARVLEQFATQVTLALKFLEQARENRYALALVESHQLAQRSSFTHDLADERRRRELAEASDDESRQLLIFGETATLELHHRTKNTLQMAASLLSMQRRASESVEVRAALDASVGRLHVLAKVHEMLCTDSENPQDITMPDLLRALGDALQASFSELSNRVQLLITAEEIVLAPDVAIPLSLLANEVMTNAYKHAFPPGASGMIAINLSCEPQNAIVLRIMDSGVGMRADARDGSLGMKLIRTLAAQLRGTLTIEKPSDSSGTVTTLRMHRPPPRPV